MQKCGSAFLDSLGPVREYIKSAAAKRAGNLSLRPLVTDRNFAASVEHFEIEVAQMAAGLLVVEPVKAHIRLLEFLRTVGEW